MSEGMKFRVEWRASEELRRQEVIETGQEPGRQDRHFHITLSDLTSDERQRLMANRKLDPGGMHSSNTADARGYLSFDPDNPDGHTRIEYVEFDEQPAIEEWLPIAEANAKTKAEQRQASDAKRKRAAVEAERRREAAKQHSDAIEALRKAGDLAGLRSYEIDGLGSAFSRNNEYNRIHSERDRAIAELVREQREQEKARWIQAHGSDHLKRAFDASYNCQRLYVTERAAVEAPGFTADVDDSVEWRDRACPSAKALDVAEIAAALPAADQCSKPVVVWLTRLPNERHTGWANVDLGENEGWEAVLMRGYLDKYDLIQIIG